MPLAASERRSAPAVMLVRPAAAHQSSSPPRPGKRCIGVLRVREDVGTHKSVQQKSRCHARSVRGRGGRRALFSYFFSRYLCLHALDQVLTNRSGPRGAATAGLSYT